MSQLDPEISGLGLLERRMLYLLHGWTFGQYFTEVYDQVVLKDHIARIEVMPQQLLYYAENPNDTIQSINLLISVLENPPYNSPSLEHLCKTVKPNNTANPKDNDLLQATKGVEDAMIFVPYFHTRATQDAKDVFDPNPNKHGFLKKKDQGGWAEEKVTDLFKKSAKDFDATNPNDLKRLNSLKAAKKAFVVRPRP